MENTYFIITQISCIVNTFCQNHVYKLPYMRQNIFINRKEAHNGSRIDKSLHSVHYNHVFAETDGKTPAWRASAIGAGGHNTDLKHRRDTRGRFLSAYADGNSAHLHAGLPGRHRLGDNAKIPAFPQADDRQSPRDNVRGGHHAERDEAAPLHS